MLWTSVPLRLTCLFVLSIFLASGCGYHFEGNKVEGRTVTIAIPYIKGDLDGQLNAELLRALSSSGYFDCVQSGAELTLEASLTAEGDDRIGYRFDRNPESGQLRDNIVGTENRRAISVNVSLIDSNAHL